MIQPQMQPPQISNVGQRIFYQTNTNHMNPQNVNHASNNNKAAIVLTNMTYGDYPSYQSSYNIHNNACLNNNNNQNMNGNNVHCNSYGYNTSIIPSTASTISHVYHNEFEDNEAIHNNTKLPLYLHNSVNSPTCTSTTTSTSPSTSTFTGKTYANRLSVSQPQPQPPSATYAQAPTALIPPSIPHNTIYANSNMMSNVNHNNRNYHINHVSSNVACTALNPVNHMHHIPKAAVTEATTAVAAPSLTKQCSNTSAISGIPSVALFPFECRRDNNNLSQSISNSISNVMETKAKIDTMNTQKNETKSNIELQKTSECKNELDVRYDCKDCGKRFKHKSNLKIHQIIHTKSALKCEFCGKKFARKGNLKQHRRVHTDERPYCCRFCPKKFKQPHSLKDHVRIHTGEKPFLCEYCGKSFNVKHNMVIHRRLHTGERPFSCSICAKRFASKSSLNGHTKKFHPAYWKIHHST